MSDQAKLAEIAKWCDLWLKGETDRKYTPELIEGLRKIATPTPEPPGHTPPSRR